MAIKFGALELALAAFPQTRTELEPPARRRRQAPPSSPLEALDLCWLPSVAAALDLGSPELPKALPTLEDDPIFFDRPEDDDS